jgi:hypothetical protein
MKKAGVYLAGNSSGWVKTKVENINHKTLDEIVESPNIKDEITRVIGKNGCSGCSTVCYFWNKEFRDKAMFPHGKWKWERQWMLTKQIAKEKFPQLYNIVKKTKSFFT